MSGTIHTTSIPGCLRLTSFHQIDSRGTFCKTFCESSFRTAGLATHYREHFWSRSAHGVLRGLHFQVPPHDCDKLVTCLEGHVLDVVVDLRMALPTFTKVFATSLHGDCGDSVYVPRGLAHGFYVVSESAVVSYAVTAEYSAAHDKGVLWSSIDFEWPDRTPLVSERDAALPRLAEFESPF